MRMPEMDGAAFLAKSRLAAPDATRMLLTGDADIQAAIAAVNQGQIFRFLTKPCPPDQLRLALKAAAEQYRLVTAERVLLEQTLHGSVKTLTNILAISNPMAFGRATRIKSHVSELAGAVGLEHRWQVEVAAMLSQLGSISLPEDIAEKYYKGHALNAEEKLIVGRLPRLTEELLSNIPRLEPVLEILSKQDMAFHAVNGKKAIPLGARVLKIVADYDDLETSGQSVQLALDTMLGREGCYDPEVFDAFARLKGTCGERQTIKEIPLQAVRLGMIFGEDVRMKNGSLLVTRGYEVTQSFIERIRNYPPGAVHEPLRIVLNNRKVEKAP